jgi:hypothetical protein
MDKGGLPINAYKLRFVFDYSDVDRKIRDVRKALQQMGNEIYKASKSVRTSNSTFGVWIESTPPKAFVNNTMRALLPANAEQVQMALTPVAQEFGIRTKDTMRKYVNRIDTGRMKQEIRYKITKRNLKTLTVEVGWIRLWYKYFDYQERGTRGVRPMHSIFKTRMEAQRDFQQTYSRFVRNYVLKAKGN